MIFLYSVLLIYTQIVRTLGNQISDNVTNNIIDSRAHISTDIYAHSERDSESNSNNSVTIIDVMNNNCSQFGATIQSKCTCTINSEGLHVDCVETDDDRLHNDIDAIHKSFNRSITHLSVRNSMLVDLTDLPSGLVDIKQLTLRNTGIDLQVIRESSEILSSLEKLKLFEESYTEIPENFFQGMNELNELWLAGVGIAAISEDAFSLLEDTLVTLYLQENRLRSIPIAITTLVRMETLHLGGNEIHSVPDDFSHKLESGLRRLNYLYMDRINCTCSFAKSHFASWIRNNAIKGVECMYPHKFRGNDVGSTLAEDYCGSSAIKTSRNTKITIFIIAIGIILSCLLT